MRILIADDHPMIRHAIEVLLRGTGHEIVGMSGNGRGTIDEIERLSPDLVLLDLQMPDGTGLDVLRELKGKGSPVQVILLTAAIDDSSLLEARALNVQGIVLKNSDPAFLLDCLDSVARGRSWTDPEIAERLRRLTATHKAAGRIQLAPRERQLIAFVRQGLRNRDIADRLAVTEGTVKAYLHAIFEKLGVRNRTELAIKADQFLADTLQGP
jgi:two-component system nitrate/nitrite response regulator NarP